MLQTTLQEETVDENLSVLLHFGANSFRSHSGPILTITRPYPALQDRAGKREDAIIWYTNQAKSLKSVRLCGRTSVWKPLIQYQFLANVRAYFEELLFLLPTKSSLKYLQSGSPNSDLRTFLES